VLARKFTASDGASGDWYGTAQAVNADGTVVVVGAYGDATQRGAVYVRHGANLATETKLVASDGVAGDWFGWSVAISDDGSVIVVGATQEDGTALKHGRAYVFSGASWTTQTILTASDGGANHHFGISVDISANGSIVAVGSHFENGERGAVYLYTGASWVTETKITASDRAAGDDYGRAVALSDDGSVLVVGAPFAEDAGFDTGKAYVYSGVAWATETMLIASDAEEDAEYGKDVAVSGDGTIAAVGAYLADSGGTNRGQVYVYSGASWGTETIVTPATPTDSEVFGTCVALSPNGGTLAVSAPTDFVASAPGSIYLFSGAGWATEQRLSRSDEAEDWLGYDVIDITDEYVVAGAPYGTAQPNGASYLWDYAPARVAAVASPTVTGVAATASAAVPLPTITAIQVVSATVAGNAAAADAAVGLPAIQVAQTVTAVPAEAPAAVSVPTVAAVRSALITGVAAGSDAAVATPVVAAIGTVSVTAVAAGASAEVSAPVIDTGGVVSASVAALAAEATATAEPPTVQVDVAVAVSTGQSFTPRRNLRAEHFAIAIRVEVPVEVRVDLELRPHVPAPIAVAVPVAVATHVVPTMRTRVKARLELAMDVDYDGNLVVYDEAEELSILGLLS
jgi:hypothetical protein